MIAFASIWRVIGPILTFGVTIPVWLIMAAYFWLMLGATIEQRRAVQSAVQELVAGAEIEAARATAEANEKLRLAAESRTQEAIRRAEAAEAANRDFALRAAQNAILAQSLQDDIDDLLSTPVSGDCAVDPDLLDRLHNAR